MSSVPDIDYSSDEYKIPGGTDSSLYNVLVPISVDQLTEKRVDGNGIFDTLMSALSAQLKFEFNENRITGSEYTKAYIAGVEVCMATALQFLLGKDAAYWEAIKSQAEAITAKLALQTAKYQTEAARYQVELIKEQTETQRAQTLETRSDGVPVGGVVDAQKSLYKQQVDSYKRDAEVKMTKIFADAWTVQKTMDEGLLPPSNFANASLDEILTKVKQLNGLD